MQTTRVYFSESAATLTIELTEETRKYLRQLAKVDGVYMASTRNDYLALRPYEVDKASLRGHGDGNMTQTIHQFIKKYGVTISNKRADSNPHLKDDRGDMHHWRCTLRVKGSPAHITIPFSQGYAHPEEPTAADVLSCMASDASAVESNGADWETFASEMGMPTETSAERRAAQRVFAACEKEREQLESSLGHNAAEELMYDTEPL